MKASNDENRVYVSGPLSEKPELDHQLFGEDFYASCMMIPRLSGTIDCVPLTLPGRVLSFFPDKDERISVWGQLRSYNRRTAQGVRLCLTVFALGMEAMEESEMPRNEITLTGYLCKPAVYRTTPFNREIGDMLLACNRSFNKADYLPCIAWGRNARLAGEIPVGGRVRIEGRIQSRRYQKLMPDGVIQDRTAHEVSCSSIEVI